MNDEPGYARAFLNRYILHYASGSAAALVETKTCIPACASTQATRFVLWLSRCFNTPMYASDLSVCLIILFYATGNGACHFL